MMAPLKEIDCTIEYMAPDLMKYTNTADWRYFVASDGDSPKKLFFNYSEAFNSDYTFIDVFDEMGELVIGFKNIDGVWIDEF